MLSLASPLWLFGLALLPVIRWLHRGGRHRRAVAVSHLGLWRRAAAVSPAAGERRPPDPAWRRRALLTALVLCALAEPQWPAQRARVTLWVDDSLSMLTREPQGTRLALGWAQVRSLLAELAVADVQVRTLADPWRSRGGITDETLATIVAGAGQREPSAPPAALLHRHGQHWLITDGADELLFDWPGARRADRVIQISGVDRNAGLQRISARRNPDDPQRIELLVKVSNGGNAAESRTVVFAADAGEAARSTVRIETGASAFAGASIAAAGQARARLEPGDALAQDDEIVLDLGPLRRRRVAVDARCPAALVTAVSAHPALEAAPPSATDVQAAVDCGSLGAVGSIATIRVLAHRPPTPLPATVLWSSSVPESRRIGLDAQRLRTAATLPAGAGDAVLLAAGEEPLIVSRAGAARRIETSLDFASAVDPPNAQIPLLFNLMFEQLFGDRLLDPIAVADRGPGSTRVAASARAPAVNAATDAGAPRQLDSAVVPPLLAALLVLLWEIAALGRQWLRSTAQAAASR